MCVLEQPEIKKFEHILAHRPDCETVNVASFTVHFDDSGTHRDGPVALVAGWVAPVEAWKRFTREWNKARAEYGFQEFHAALMMANNDDSEFADTNVWTDHKKRAVYQRLAAITKEHCVQGFSIGVIKSDYDTALPPAHRALAGNYHYTYAVRSVVAHVETWARQRGLAGQIEYIFDTMTKGKAKTEIDYVFEAAALMFKRGLENGVPAGSHSFRDAAIVLPLQACDLLAWTLLQGYHQQLGKGHAMDYVAKMFNSFVSGKVISRYNTKEQLEQFALHVPKMVVQVPKDWNMNSGRKRKAQEKRALAALSRR